MVASAPTQKPPKKTKKTPRKRRPSGRRFNIRPYGRFLSLSPNKDLCIITDPLHNQGSACLGRRNMPAEQSAITQNKGQKFQNIDRVKAPAKGAGRRYLAVPPGGT
jgi:hypothetical protein